MSSLLDKKMVEECILCLGRIGHTISGKLKDATKGAVKEGAKTGVGGALLFMLKRGLNLLGFPIP